MAIAPIDIVFRGINQTKSAINGIVGDLAGIGLAFNGIESAIGQLQSAYGKFYNAFVQQNVDLQNQLLSTQASLAATTKVIANGLEVIDPTKAIQALQAPVDAAIESIRLQSLDLVGTTSADLVPIFQFIAQESSNINATLQQGADLTISFAAALGTLKIPLWQARQEVLSIVQGQITMDSALAKNIGLNNDMINKWKSQGVLVDKLNERLAAFTAGNKLAAQTIDGVTSNIDEVFQEITRMAGEPLLAPIVEQLNKVYEFLYDNREEIANTVSEIINFFLTTAEKFGAIAAMLKPVFEKIAAIGLDTLSAAGQLAATTITTLVEVLSALTPVLVPLLNITLAVVSAFAELAATDAGQLMLQTVVAVNLLLKTLTLLQIALISLKSAFAVASVAITLFKAVLAANTVQLLAFSNSFALIYPKLALFTTMVAAAGGGLTGFTAALLAAVTPVVAAAAPFVVLGAAIATAIVKISEWVAADKQAAIDAYGKQFDNVADSALKTARSLKTLNDAEKITGKLTEEEAKKRDQLRKSAGSQIELLKTQLEELKKFNQANPNDQTKAQIGLTERYIKMLQTQSGETKTTAKDVEDLGNTYQQLGKRAEEALSKLNYDGQSRSPAATVADYQKAGEDLIKITSKAYELGQVSVASLDELGMRSSEIAISRLEKVRDDAKQTYDTQLSAQQEITKIRQIETDKQLKGVEIQQSKIQALISGEVLSQGEGQRRITQEKIKQLDIQLEATRVAIEEEKALRTSLLNAGNTQSADEIKNNIKKLNAEIAAINAKGGDDKLTAQERQQRLSLQSQVNYLNRIKEFKGVEKALSDEAFTLAVERDELLAKRIEGGTLTPDEVAKERSLTAQIDTLEGQKAAAKQALAEDTKSLTDLKANQEKLTAERVAANQEIIKIDRARRLEDFDEELQQTDALYNRFLITQEEFNKKSKDLTVAKANEELAQLEEQRKKLDPEDREGQQALVTRRAVLLKQIAEVEEKYLADKAKNQQLFLDVEQKQLEARNADGLVSTAEYNQQTLALVQQKTDAELAEIDRIRDYTREDDIVRLAELDAREAEALSRFIAAQERFRQEQINQIELAQREANAKVKASEIERLTTIAQLESDLTLKKVEADALRGESSRATAEAEIELEKEKLAQLEALQPESNEQKERQRLLNIANLRLSIAQRTKSLIDDEIQQRQRLFAVVEDKLNIQQQQNRNIATASQNSIQKEIQLQNALRTSLDQQNQLLNARKDLVSSTQGFLSGQLNILKETSRTEREKKQIAETEAQIRLSTVQEQFRVEKLVLDLKIRQRDLALEQQKLQLQSQAIAAQVEEKQAKIELEKLEAKKAGGIRVSDEEFEVTRLQIEGAQIKSAGIVQQRIGLDQQGEINQVLGAQEQQALANREATEVGQARLNLAQNRRRRGVSRREMRALREETARNLRLGNDSGEGVSVERLRRLGDNFDAGSLQLPGTEKKLPPLRQGTLDDLQERLNEQARLGQTAQPQLARRVPNLVTGDQASQQIGTTTTAGLANTINQTYNVYINKDDIEGGKAAKSFTDQVRKELKETLLVVARQ